MARPSASKNRATDKSRTPAAQTPPVSHEIVPGRFNDADWYQMLERDGSEEYIAGLVDDLIDATMGIIFKNYLDQQLFPFTITQAKDAIVEIIEWYFLAPDDGERHICSDLGWAEDEEPESSDTDCWAQGSIPKSIIAAALPDISEEVPEVAKVEANLIDLIYSEETPPSELPDTVSESEEFLSGDTITDAESEITYVKKDETAKQQDQKYSVRMKPQGITRKTTSKEIPVIKKMANESIESMERPVVVQEIPNSCRSLTKVIFSHPTGAKDALYDDMGNVIAVPKLDPEKLPTHKVNVKYIVVDASQESPLIKVDLKKKIGLTGKQKSEYSMSSNNKAIPGRRASLMFQRRHSKISPKGSTLAEKNLQPGTVPPLRDTGSTFEGDYTYQVSMADDGELSQGITIIEDGRVKKGPGRYYRKLDILDNVKGMKPVSLRMTNPEITVADLLDRQTPILHNFGDSTPLPPIVPQPPQHAKQMS